MPQHTHQQGPTGDRESSDCDEQSDRGSNGGSEKQGGRDTSPLEWTLAAVSALLVLGAIGHLLYEALAESSTPPEVQITVEAIRPTGSRALSGYLVEFKAENRGQTTAARVNVEGTLKRGSETVETSSTTIDYVPAEGSRRGGLYFTEDPQDFELELRPTGYDRP